MTCVVRANFSREEAELTGGVVVVVRVAREAEKRLEG